MQQGPALLQRIWLAKMENELLPRSPPQVHFSANRTLCDVRVASVESTQTEQPIKYGSNTVLVTEGYTVE